LEVIGMKRRDLLKMAALLGSLSLAPKGLAQGAPQNAPALGRRYRNLIVFV
jgi:alkaline phosphatase